MFVCARLARAIERKISSIQMHGHWTDPDMIRLNVKNEKWEKKNTNGLLWFEAINVIFCFFFLINLWARINRGETLLFYFHIHSLPIQKIWISWIVLKWDLFFSFLRYYRLWFAHICSFNLFYSYRKLNQRRDFSIIVGLARERHTCKFSFQMQTGYTFFKKNHSYNKMKRWTNAQIAKRKLGN